MMPMASSSSSSATVAVDKATSDLLISPDWTMNIDICDSVNSSQWQAKDVVKALKKRLQHRNPKVQMLSLTLLETMVKNCGDYAHFQIGERNILGEMIKIVKKKADMQVREKILALLDSWQEAFGGPGGKYPQYYWAYDELRRAGVEFPKRRSSDVALIITPPIAHPTKMHAQPGYGMPSNSSRRLDETMATEIESLSLSGMESMQNIMELLSDMLQAVNPNDRAAVKDEVIVELVNRCRANQKKLMQMVTITGDEQLLARGLELNDGLQSLLAKHDAIASGSLMLAQAANSSPQHSGTTASSLRQAEVRDSNPRDLSHVSNVNSAALVPVNTSQIYEDDEEEDEFVQLARRHSKTRPVTLQSTNGGTNGDLAIVNTSTPTAATETVSTSSPSNALALPDPPAPVKTKEQDMIDLLSITLSTIDVSPDASKPVSSNQNTNQVPTSPSKQGYPHGSQTYPGVKSQIPYRNYVVPWAQPQLQQPQPPLQSQFPHLYRQQLQPPHQPQLHPQGQPQSPQHLQSPNYSSAYPPPPWAPTPGYFYNQTHMVPNNLSSRADATVSYPQVQGTRNMHNYNSFPSKEMNGSAIHVESQTGTSPRNNATPASPKPFVPSYRLFEDLNVFGTADGKLKMTSSNPTSSLAGASGPSMVGGRK